MRIEGERFFVTGGLGFIGRHLVRALVGNGASVVVFDRAGRSPEVLRALLESGRVTVLHGDLRTSDLRSAMDGCAAVVHLAANADVRDGEARPGEMFRDNVLATARLLDGMAAAKVARFALASTSTIYGETAVTPTTEDHASLAPISIYGASKLAAEGLVHGFAAAHACTAAIWRLANVVGPDGHGVVNDIVRKLRADPRELEIFGREPGTRKSYIHVDDAIDGMLQAWAAVPEGVGTFNVGSEDAITVKEVADEVCRGLSLSGVQYRWTGGVDGGGWRGDMRTMQLAVEKLRATGWRPRHGSAEAVFHVAKALADAPDPSAA